MFFTDFRRSFTSFYFCLEVTGKAVWMLSLRLENAARGPLVFLCESCWHCVRLIQQPYNVSQRPGIWCLKNILLVQETFTYEILCINQDRK